MINICPNCKGIIGKNDVQCPKCVINILDFKEEVESESKTAKHNSKIESQNTMAEPKNNASQQTTSPKFNNAHINARQDNQNINISNSTLKRLKTDIGIFSLEKCTKKESKEFTELLKSDRENQIPDDIIYNGYEFYRRIRKVPSDQEELYILMRISNDLHFIKVPYQVSLILGIIAAIVIPLATLR